MLDKGKISAAQMGMMLFLAVVASGVMWIPGISGQYAKADMWLSPLWASFAGLLTVLVAYRLHVLYPERTAIQYSEEILGRLSGKAVGLVIVLFYLHITGFIVRSYAEFIVANFLHKTPITAVIVTMILVSAFAVSRGVEVLGRTAQLFVPIFLIPVLFMPLLVREMKLGNVFPILEHGVIPSLQGALVPSGWFCEMFLMSFYLPFVHNQTKGMRASLVSLLGIMLLLTIVNLFILLVLGKQAPDFLFPVMVAFRYISIADFFENMESLIMAIWIYGMFVKISVFYYASVLGASQWLKMSEYRTLVLPLGVFVGVLSFWSFPDFNGIVQFNTFTFPFYATLIQTLLPLLLLGVGSIRRKRERNA